jgi:hypothetical protein
MSSLAGKILAMQRHSDWDGEKAKAITFATCKAARRFSECIDSRHLPSPILVSPSPMGVIGFLWESKNARLSIQVRSLAAGGLFVRWSDGLSRESIKCDIEKALEVLKDFSKVSQGR